MSAEEKNEEAALEGSGASASLRGPRPVSSAARDGVHMGAATMARVKRVPRPWLYTYRKPSRSLSPCAHRSRSASPSLPGGHVVHRSLASAAGAERDNAHNVLLSTEQVPCGRLQGISFRAKNPPGHD